MRVLVVGGCGYIGSVLVPKLMLAGHEVHVIDIQWFGNHLGRPVERIDFRSEFIWPQVDAVIHLANVANDPQGELDPRLTWEVNALGMIKLVEDAICVGAKQFIYASSGSVYGVSDKPHVTENSALIPISDYNKSKAVAERVLQSYADQIVVQIVRPGTVCGLSPRQRLDVTVNKYTIQALTTWCVKLEGGAQYRPHVHIEDVTDAFQWLLERPELAGVYNCGFENLTLKEVARMVTDKLNCRTLAVPSDDPRSYRLNSEKLLATGFTPKRSVSDAIDELIERYRAGKLKDEDRCHNVRAMPRAV